MTRTEDQKRRSREAANKWRKANPEKAAESNRRSKAKQYAKDPEKHIQRKREWEARNPDWQRAYDLRTKYGLTIDEYDALSQKQDGVCAICKQKDARYSYLPVDHDHLTGKVRGLLCSLCNRGLGFFREHPEHLHTAIEYLKEN